MNPSARLAEMLVPLAVQRFGLVHSPAIQIESGAGLGSGVKFRVSWPGCAEGLIESNVSIRDLLAHAALGGQLKFDHNGLHHKVSFVAPLLRAA